jgi:hypothetical protein
MEVFKYYLTLKVNVWKYIYLSPPTIIPWEGILIVIGN